MQPKKIAIFASGGGSNADNIIKYFKDKAEIATIELVLTNNPDAAVIKKARDSSIPVLVFDKKVFKETNKIVNLLENLAIDLIILAGFLWLVPENLVRAFPTKIINIHPALLPKFGGKGMFGIHVHEAVYNSEETQTGITIHYVNEHYDEGKHIAQFSFELSNSDTPKTIEAKIHALELANFPRVIETLCLS